MTTKAKLRSDRLRLREKSLEDAWNDYQWRSDEELARPGRRRSVAHVLSGIRQIFR